MPYSAAEAERKISERLSNHAPWGVLHCDAEHRILGANVWIHEAFAVSDDHLVGKRLSEFAEIDGNDIDALLAASSTDNDTYIPALRIITAHRSEDFSVLIRRSTVLGNFSISIAPTASQLTEASLIHAVQAFLSDVHAHQTLQGINEILQKHFRPMNIGIFCAMNLEGPTVARTLRNQRPIEAFDFFGVWVFGNQIPLNRIGDSQRLTKVLAVLSVRDQFTRFVDTFGALLDPVTSSAFAERYVMAGLNRLQSFNLLSHNVQIGHLSFIGPFIDLEILRKLDAFFQSIQSVFSQLHERAVLESQVHRLERLNTYINQLGRTMRLDALYPTIAYTAREIFDATHCYVLLRGSDDYSALVLDADPAIAQAPCRYAWDVVPTEAARWLSADINQDMFLRTLPADVELAAVLAVPLFDNQRCFAVVYIGNVHEELLLANDLMYARQFSEYVSASHSRLTLTQSLDESEKRYRFLLNESSNPVLVVDAEDRVLHINHAGRRLVGIDDESTMLFSDVLTEQTVQRWESERMRLEAGGIDKVFWSGEALNVMRHTKIPFEAEVICLQQSDARIEYLITLQDITQRIRLVQQHRLRENELDLLARIAAVVNSSLDPSVLLDRAFDILDEVEFGSMYGVILLGDDQQPYLAAHRHIPADLLPVAQNNPTILRGGLELVLSNTDQPDYASVYSLKSIYSNDMIAQFGNLIGAKISADDKTIGAVLASRPFQGSVDFTPRDIQMLQTIANHLAHGITNARLHQSLQIAANRYSTLYTEAETIRAHLSSVIESSPDALVLLQRLSWTMRILNDAPFVGWGYAPGVLQHLPMHAICPPDSYARLDEHLTRVQLQTAYSFEFSLLRADGSVFAALLSSKYVNETEILVSIKDVSQMRLLEHRIKEREKLSLLGQMVASVAHELNNPIAVIRGIAQLQLLQDNTTDVNADFAVIERTSHRAARIVQQLRLLGQPQKIEHAVFDFASVVSSIVQQQQTLLRHAQIDCTVDLACETCLIRGDVAQLEQVLVNLIDNAARAILPSMPIKQIGLHVSLHEDTLVLRVSDTGVGISPSDRGRLFEPFFTTRPIGEGLGLGLAIVSTIVSQHHGTITAEANQPQGTTIVLTLPTAAAPRLVVARQTIASDTYLTILDVLRDISTIPVIETDTFSTDADVVVIDAAQYATLPVASHHTTAFCIISTSQTTIADHEGANVVVCTPQMDTILLRQILTALTAPLQSR